MHIQQRWDWHLQTKMKTMPLLSFVMYFLWVQDVIIRIALYIHSIDPSHLFFFKWRNSCLLEKFLIDYWTHLGRVENWVYTLQKNTSIGNVICFSNKKLTIFLCARWTRQTPNMFECCENCVRTLTADLMSDFEAAINCSLMAEVLYIFSFWRCFINKMN